MKRMKKDIWNDMPELDLGLESDSLEDALSASYNISDTKYKFLFVYTASPDKFKHAFSKYVTIDSNDDIEFLALMNINGDDKRQFGISFEDIVDGIMLTQNEASAAYRNITFGC